MRVTKRLLALVLIISFFFNTTAVLAVSFYTDQNTGVRAVSVEKEKERLQKKFTSLKEWVQEVTPFEKFADKNQRFFSGFREEVTRFFDKFRTIIQQQWDRNFTTL